MAGIAKQLIGVLGLVLVTGLSIAIGVVVADRTHRRDPSQRSLWSASDDRSFIVPVSRSNTRPCTADVGEPECPP